MHNRYRTITQAIRDARSSVPSSGDTARRDRSRAALELFLARNAPNSTAAQR